MSAHEWYTDRNLRTPRSMREAGIESGPFTDTLLSDEPRVLAFIAGFSLGVMATVLLITLRVLP
jgi:hypothetical protein